MAQLGSGKPDRGPADTAATIDVEALEHLGQARNTLRDEVAKVIIGQEQVIDDLLTAIFARGHCLMVGVPGLAKTLMVQTIARAIDLEFNRIQFTPDLMPADITGTEVIEQDRTADKRVFRFIRGPVFANILLADEINRTPPKTQAALLQSMQERQVTSGGQTYDLPKPFFGLATQNPKEPEGTYPQPAAPHDPFMFMLKVDPDRAGYPQPPADHPSGAGLRPRGPLRTETRPRHPARRPHRTRVRQGTGHLGHRAARHPVPRAGSQGTRGAGRRVQRHRGARQAGDGPRLPAPPHPQLPRRGSGPRRRRHHHATPR